jgi:hypothetical protein
MSVLTDACIDMHMSIGTHAYGILPLSANAVAEEGWRSSFFSIQVQKGSLSEPNCLED